jgi:hypothetical protein
MSEPTDESLPPASPPAPPPNTPLDYESPFGTQRDSDDDGDGGDTPGIQFFVGLIGGLAGGALLSYCVYHWGWRAWVAAVILVPAFKLGVGAGLVQRRGKRGLGIGLLLSIVLGALIITRECGVHFKI